MDCPNSILGGTNSIRLCLGIDPTGAAQLANDCSQSDDEFKSANNGVTHVKRADGWGNINWGICLME